MGGRGSYSSRGGRSSGSVKLAGTVKLPKLEGTPKQVEWAEKIRKEMISTFDNETGVHFDKFKGKVTNHQIIANTMENYYYFVGKDYRKKVKELSMTELKEYRHASRKEALRHGGTKDPEAVKAAKRLLQKRKQIMAKDLRRALSKEKSASKYIDNRRDPYRILRDYI